jgi:hypothetical protein
MQPIRYSFACAIRTIFLAIFSGERTNEGCLWHAQCGFEQIKISHARWASVSGYLIAMDFQHRWHEVLFVDGRLIPIRASPAICVAIL